jgi:hypothetical protein
VRRRDHTRRCRRGWRRPTQVPRFLPSAPPIGQPRVESCFPGCSDRRRSPPPIMQVRRRCETSARSRASRAPQVPRLRPRERLDSVRRQGQSDPRILDP